MAQATFSVRMDENLKKQFDDLCQEFGMNTSTAVTREGALEAFNALRAEAADNGVSGMSLKEINAEISASRKGTAK